MLALTAIIQVLCIYIYIGRFAVYGAGICLHKDTDLACVTYVWGKQLEQNNSQARSKCKNKYIKK